MNRLLLLVMLLACGDAAAFKPGALGGHSGLGRKCGALGNCGGAARNAFVIVAAGNSLVSGSDTTSPWVTQMGTMLATTGATYSLQNKGHGGETTQQLQARIPADVDAYWDATKINVLVFQEVINDIGLTPSTGAQAYANVQAYMNALTRPWYKILIMPTPAHTPGTPVPAFEIGRQAFITLVNSDPTFGGKVDAVWRVDSDPRLGLDAAADDAYYYCTSGCGTNKVHWIARSDGIAAAAIMDVLRARWPGSFPYTPQQMPYEAAGFSAAVSGSVLTTSGGPAADGNNVATWVHDGAIESGNATQSTGANQPVYSVTGFGGRPALTMGAAKRLTAGNATIGKGTFAATVYTTGGGFVAQGGSDTRLGAAEVNNAQTVKYSVYNLVAGAGTVKTQLAGSIHGAPHVLVYVFDGTYAGAKIYVDGTEITLTQYLAYGADCGSTPVLSPFTVGDFTNGMIGSLGELYASPIPFNTTERQNLERYLGALRGITVAP